MPPISARVLGVLLLAGCTGENARPSGEAGPDGDTRESSDAIIDGVPVLGAGPFEQWEGIVQLVSPKGSCTGVFITGSHVLTAGHCFVEEGTQAILLRAPTWDDGRWHSYLEARVRVRGTGPADDVAVIALPSPEPWAAPARRFRLLTSPAAGSMLAIYGYGAYDQAGESDGALRAPPFGAKIRVRDDHSGHFKAEVGDARICWGDSGGPALSEGTFAIVHGVAHSFSYEEGKDRPCPTESHDMTWTKASANLPFIEREIGLPCSRFTLDGQTYARCW